MINVDIDMSEVTNWINNQSNRDRAKRFMLTNIKNEQVEELNDEMSIHNLTNQTSQSIMGEVQGDSAVIYGKNYVENVLEYGRRPGKMPPVQALEDWADKRLGDKNLAFLVARKIARMGTSKYREGGPKQITDMLKGKFGRFLDKELIKLADEYTE